MYIVTFHLLMPFVVHEHEQHVGELFKVDRTEHDLSFQS